MADEQTTPEVAGVSTDEDIQSRLVSFYTKGARQAKESESTEARPEADAEEQPSEQPDNGEPTADDLPDEEVAEGTDSQPVDEFEIVHNGTQHKLTRDEAIRLAQQGFDYTQKTQALAEQARAVNERFQRVAAIEQVVPQLQQAQAQVAALGAQLAPYQRVDWVALATADPLEYSKVRAQYDVLAQTYQQAAGQYESLRGAIGQQAQALHAQSLQVEAQKLTERIPAWKDPAKYKQDATALREYLIAEGAAPEEVDGLSSSVAVSIAYKAMQYDRLVKSKAEKTKLLTTKPPMTKPGAATTNQSAGSQDYTKARQSLKKTGDWRDAAKILARMK